MTEMNYNDKGNVGDARAKIIFKMAAKVFESVKNKEKMKLMSPMNHKIKVQ